MEPTPPWAPRKTRRLIVILGLLILVPAAFALGKAILLQRRLERAIESANRMRVWSAGIRTGGSAFCACSPVNKPERLLHQTRNPEEIRDLVSQISARPHLWTDPLTKNCGVLTFDFLRDEELLLSLHLQGDTIRSTFVSWWDMPIRSQSEERINRWVLNAGIGTTPDDPTKK